MRKRGGVNGNHPNVNIVLSGEYVDTKCECNVKNKRILICSGGGVKGYAQAQVLKKLEKDYGPLHERYDLVCGSSVGAINGSMLASGRITMDRLEKIIQCMLI